MDDERYRTESTVGVDRFWLPLPFSEVGGRGLDVPVVSIPADQVSDHFGWLGRFFGIDSVVSNELTHELLDWQPTHHGLIADLDEGHYFRHR